MTLPELSRKIGETGVSGGYRYHFHRRLSLAVSCLSFGLLGIPLGMAQRARGKSSAFAVMMVIVLVYYLFIAAAGVLESRAPRGMIVLLWAPNTLGLSLAAWILWRSERSLATLPASLGTLLARK